MPDSKSQKIVTEIVNRMKLINGTGGYSTNFADRVEDARPNWDQDELPACSVVEGQTETGDGNKPGNLGRVIHEMSVMIKVFLKRGTSAANARAAIADIMAAIRTDDRWKVGGVGLAMQTFQKGHGIEYDPESFELTGAQVIIGVQYITGKWNAYE
jgi:hypothetical protein